MNNPVTTNIRLQVSLPKADQLNLTVTDLSGRQVMQQEIVVSAGISQLDIPVPSSAGMGVYVLRVSGEQVKKSLRILVRR